MLYKARQAEQVIIESHDQWHSCALSEAVLEINDQRFVVSGYIDCITGVPPLGRVSINIFSQIITVNVGRVISDSQCLQLQGTLISQQYFGNWTIPRIKDELPFVLCRWQQERHIGCVRGRKEEQALVYLLSRSEMGIPFSWPAISRALNSGNLLNFI